MASYPIPPWLQSQNPAPFFLQGVNQGADIAAQQNASDRAAATMQMQRAQMEQQQRMEAFNAAQKAVQLQMSVDEQRRQRELDQARLVGITQENQAKAQEMAGRMRFQQEFGKRVAAGVDPSQALFQTLPFAPLSISAPLLAAQARNAEAEKRMLLSSALQVERNTGEKVVGQDLTVDEAARQRANAKNAALKLSAPIRTAESLIGDMETLLGRKMTDEEKALNRSVLTTNGNRAPVLDPATRSQLNVAEYAVDATERLLNEIKKHPEVKFGPGIFTFNQKTGEWIGADPETSKIAQLYNILYAGQAFAKGGKALTGTEIQTIRSEIGQPTNVNFVSQLETARGQYISNLGKGIRDLQDRHFDVFPTYRDHLKRLEEQFNAAAKGDANVTGEYAAPRGFVQGQATGRVSVISPSGKSGTIPASQLDEALKKGFRRGQ